MQLLGFPLTKQEIADFVEKDGEDDAVSFDVFSNFVLDKMSKVPPEEESLRAFRLIDKDHRGFIEYKSLKRAATDCNSDLAYAPDILKSIISSIDKDGDNRLSYEEFERAYMKSLE
ncbi:hypothetical protein BLNAU_4587 [Blattamonas nauphoetae]|uniref:EF-hand domain-containing protein n=1 Tax=Blattamonas nauphoetae TaxID=2049346 RepID=A0ABQ9Y9E3_9EUKA|nr:hypothetical protein BLNAU_4587 [Blattamonas nauphoetae]